jgi:hypothetical protein
MSGQPVSSGDSQGRAALTDLCKTYRNKYIVDTAFCSGCESTAITYDIDFDSDMLSELSKFTGKSESLLLKDLNGKR